MSRKNISSGEAPSAETSPDTEKPEVPAAAPVETAAPPAVAVADVPTFTLLELAKKTGNLDASTPTVFQGTTRPTDPRFSTVHQIAAQLHGWGEHESHTASKLRLSVADYVAALAAARPKEGNPTPHGPAMSPYHWAVRRERREARRAAKKEASR